MKSNTRKVRDAVENAFCSIYPIKSKNPNIVFSCDEGESFSIVALGDVEPWNFIVIEYQECGEDGDGFYPEDYDSIEKLISDMRKEIDG